MTIQELNKELGNIDIYLLDQILKGRYASDTRILDAGCGEGRNIVYFLNNGFEVHGIDKSSDAIRLLKFIIGSSYPNVSKNNFRQGSIEQLDYPDGHFGLVICSAVLHFAENTANFEAMFEQVVRVLAPEGQLFIRMTSDIGLDMSGFEKDGDLHQLGDGTLRFLITPDHLTALMNRFNLEFVEPLKSTNVNGLRSMATLVLKKVG